MAKQVIEFNDVKNKSKFLLIYVTIPIFIIILALYFNCNSYDEFYRQMAIKALQKECAKKCTSYGVSQGDLVGPKMEYEGHNKFQSNYIFSWHSDNPVVTVKVHEYHNTSSATETIEFEWTSSKS